MSVVIMRIAEWDISYSSFYGSFILICFLLSFSCRGEFLEMKRGPQLPIQEKYVFLLTLFFFFKTFIFFFHIFDLNVIYVYLSICFHMLTIPIIALYYLEKFDHSHLGFFIYFFIFN